jgi:hypothetical protein
MEGGRAEVGYEAFCWISVSARYRHHARDVEVLATFLDGKPAICHRRHGKGLGIWIGTFCSLAVQAGSVCPSGAVVTRWAVPGGYPEIQAIDATSGVFVRAYRAAEDALILVAVNYAENEADLRVIYSDPEGGAVRDREKGSTHELKVRLRARDGQIARLPMGALGEGQNAPRRR